MRVCKKCLKSKLLIDFYKHPRYKGGYRSYCKDCGNKMNKESYKKRSLLHKPICKRLGCGKRVPYRRSIICSDACYSILKAEAAREHMRNVYVRDAYRKSHREYMRKYNNIDPKKYKAL